ncbi:enolase C-terminal domain-like protein [Sorangium atrum]|uniref:L-fuconate dehydratase n=1 Tax=Sorangium atrum TaxID=2995308 RepID=A0ABT5CCB7_9BACT|nr:enolase C-terminal domain-like protein [Sorangium aterium]MDC0684077.1 enolase C-terminal domain-like protein [Sorangium aterium]
MVWTGIITDVRVSDVRFPTSLTLDGSDATNRDPDYSAAYVVIETDRRDGVTGHGLAFTIGRGTEVVVAGIHALRHLVVGKPIAAFTSSPGEFWKLLTGDSQIRWLGPDKGVMHLATAAVVNALWDLWAKLEQKPLWKLLSELSPEQIVELVDWRYLSDALTPEEARRSLDRLVPTRDARAAAMLDEGYPAYTTSVGWLGYPDEKIRRACREGIEQGFSRFKLKVGLDLGDDLRRTALVRDMIGPEHTLMIDANQRWGVEQAIEWVRRLAPTRPWWIEEPTSPDDVLGHAAIARALEPLGIGVASGEHCANSVMFKQFMQAGAISFCQIDFCRLAGVNEVVAVLLLAAHFGVPVCPHAGGVGLCEYVPHASLFDYIAVSASLERRCIEFVDHLHEHFVDPCVVRGGRYLAPTAPGTSITMKADSLAAHTFPGGQVWQDLSERS